MAYLTDTYNPPPVKDVGPLKTFGDLRTGIARIHEYLHQVRSSEITYFAHLQENLNQNTSTQGPDIPATTTIQITKFMHVITGTGTVTTIVPPANYTGQVMLISRDGFNMANGGNISLFSSPNFLSAGAHIILTFVQSKNLWFADTCRLFGAGSGSIPGGPGALVSPALQGPGINISPSTFIISNAGVTSITPTSLQVAATGTPTVGGLTGNVTLSLDGPHNFTNMLNNAVVIGNGGSPLSSVGPGIANQVLIGQNANPPTFSAINTGYLTDIVTGTFLPILSGSGTAGTFTYTTQTAFTMQIGPWMIMTFNIQWSAVSGSPTGNVQISLPLSAATLTSGNWGGVVMSHTGVTYTSANFTYVALRALSGATQVNIIQNGSAQTSTILPISALGTSGVLQGQIAYRTA